ncbi:MAG: glucoamylase family protein, partial [Candidatus Omnitrophica bacterium]|nr:glucoamylase family protein [Candidatus Omnitrophota bacterium]
AVNINALLNAMAAILPYVEALIGGMNFFDTNYEDNGYLSYWGERAVTEGSASIIALLQAIAAILPSVETLIGRPVDLFDGSDPANGFLGYWAERVVAEGSAKIIALLNAMAGIINEVEDLIGEVDFFDTNYEDNGFLTFWAEYALTNGVQHTKNVLSNMKNILDNDFDNNGTPEVEELIGPVDLFDNNYDDNGFITYWAEHALTQGVNNVNRGLYIWKRLLPHVEAYEGRNLNLFIGNDAGILSFWMDEVLKLINQNGLGLEEAIQEIIKRLSEGKTLASFLYNTADNIADFFQEGIGIDPVTGLPYSWITFTKEGKIYQPEYTSISDIGMYIVSLVSLLKLDKLSQQELELTISQLLDTLNTMQTYSPASGQYQGKTYFFNYYDLPSKDVTINTFLSSVDNANLLMGLILAREACPNLAGSLQELIDKIDLGFFYDQSEHLFLGGYNYNHLNGTITPSGYHYGIMNSETRLLTYLALGKGDMTQAEALLNWQALATNMLKIYGIDVVASYGGSLFEFLFPALFIDEAQLSPNGFGLNFKKAVLIHKLQAIENGYPFWGEAPCYNDIYEYREFGSPAGLNPYPSSGMLSPYTVLLSYNAVQEGGDLIQLIENLYQGSINSQFGLIDAIDVNNDLGIYLNTSLLQGIALAAITNSLNNGIRGLFAGSLEYARIAEFISNTAFFDETGLNSELTSVRNTINDSIATGAWQKAEALFNYFKDLVTAYGKQALFPDLAQIEANLRQAIEEDLSQLYDEAQNLFNLEDYQEAITAFQTILYYDASYKNVKELLYLARGERDANVIIPNLDTLLTAFEDGTRPNAYISKIGPVDGPNGSIDVSIVSDKDKTQGKVLKLDYKLQPGGFNGIYMNIDGLSLSNTGKLVFDIKGDSSVGIPSKIKIELHPEGSSWPYPSIEIDNITEDWQTIEIDLSAFVSALGANFKLEQIAIMLEGDKVGNNQGAIYIDNIGFQE